MSEREAFIAAIAANPDDDLPRLVFADWLDENGDPDRAEFIRVQCELAKPEVWQEAVIREQLLVQVQNLLDTHRNRWTEPVVASFGLTDDAQPVRRPVVPLSFWRRVSERLSLSRVTIEQDHEAPVEKISANYGFDPIAYFAAGLLDAANRIELRDWLSWQLVRGFVENLLIDPVRFPANASLAELFRIEPVSSLILYLTDGGEPEHWGGFAGEYFNRLRTLRLVRRHPFGQLDPRPLVDAVVRSPHLTGVRRVEVGGPFSQHLAWSFSGVLVRSPLFRQVTHLAVENTPDFVSQLLTAPADPAVRVLDLKACSPLTDLCRVPFRDRIEALILDESDIDPLEAFHPGDQPWARLRLLDLRGNWSNEGTQALFASDRFPELRELFLRGHPLGPDGANLLAEAPFLPQLEILELPHHMLGDLEVMAIVDRLNPKRVRHLDLSGNPLSQNMREELVARFGNQIHIGSGNVTGNPGWG